MSFAIKNFTLFSLLTTILFTIVCQNNTQTPEIETSTPQFVQIVKKEAKIEKLKPDSIEGEDYNGEGGTDTYGFTRNCITSRFYINPDFYRLTSNETLTIISRFNMIQQSVHVEML